MLMFLPAKPAMPQRHGCRPLPSFFCLFLSCLSLSCLCLFCLSLLSMKAAGLVVINLFTFDIVVGANQGSKAHCHLRCKAINPVCLLLSLILQSLLSLRLAAVFMIPLFAEPTSRLCPSKTSARFDTQQSCGFAACTTTDIPSVKSYRRCCGIRCLSGAQPYLRVCSLRNHRYAECQFLQMSLWQIIYLHVCSLRNHRYAECQFLQVSLWHTIYLRVQQRQGGPAGSDVTGLGAGRALVHRPSGR